jgi:S-(hydroxymethyl)glutathione dehydrogenase/alcohol dehydrogenase
MRAAILIAQRRPLELAEIEAPSVLRFGQVRVRVHFTGICGSQLGEIDGVKGTDPWLPHLLGHEGSGTVLEVGEGVRTAVPGDRVVLHWMRGAGIEAPPSAYDWDGTTVNAGWVTTFNEEAIVSENRVTRLPDDVDLEVAALFGCAVTTGAGVVTNDAALQLGESIVVMGAGGIGLSVVQAAALTGAHPVVAVDLYDAKLDLARRLGATDTVNAAISDVEVGIRGVLAGEGADVIVENTGNPRMIELAYSLTAAQGRTILVGVPPLDDRPSLYTLPLHFGKVLRGSHGGGTRPEIDIPRYAALYRAGKLDLEALVTNRYDLDRINDAIADLRAGRVVGRALVAVSSP